MVTMLKDTTRVVINRLARLSSHVNRKRLGANKDLTLMAKLQSIQDHQQRRISTTSDIQDHQQRRISMSSETEYKEELTRYFYARIKKLEAQIKKLGDEEDSLLEMIANSDGREALCELGKS